LTAFFDALPDMVSGLVRAKGVFRVLDTWLWLNWTEGRWAANQVAWRRDNRFELIASQIDVARVEAALQACVLPKQ
jgi:G3E family GTPase